MQELEVVQPNQLEQTLEALPEQAEPLNEAANTTQSTEAEPVQSPAPSVERNLKALRELKERAEKERDQAMRKAAELEARLSQPTQEDDNFMIGNDELAEGKHLAKVDRRIKKLEEQLRQTHAQSEQSLIETRLKMEYPDIETVVNKDNIELLSAQYPALAATLNSSPDLYNKAVSAYTMIKKLGIVENTQNQTRIQENTSKPRTITSLSPQQGDSPLSNANAFANGLTPDLKQKLWKEMQDYMR